jgi:hypothetical protein
MDEAPGVVVGGVARWGGVLQPANTSTIAAHAGAHLRTFKNMIVYLFNMLNVRDGRTSYA